MSSPPRRLEDRIRELCKRAVEAKDEDFFLVLDELHIALNAFRQLRLALDDLSQRMENKAPNVPAWPDFPRDRRKADRVRQGLEVPADGKNHQSTDAQITHTNRKKKVPAE